MPTKGAQKDKEKVVESPVSNEASTSESHPTSSDAMPAEAANPTPASTPAPPPQIFHFEGSRDADSVSIQDITETSLNITDSSVSTVTAPLPSTTSTRKPYYPSKTRASLKRPFLSTDHSNILASNPFAILISSPKKTLNLSSLLNPQKTAFRPHKTSFPSAFGTPSF
ncbi:DUF4283 domain-containing protein [Raphanus sativus]|nr:DUF4283 domain-containing protein [Raphanus sativus]